MLKRNDFYRVLLAGILTFARPQPASSQTQLLDDFSDADGWQIIASDGVRISTTVAAGYLGDCIRIDFDFQSGAGYCGIRKSFPMKLPEHYRFQFFIRGEAPVNNLEFKLTDAAAENVWWHNRRHFSFPNEWQKQTVKKRHLTFAWGPTQDRDLTAFDMIEFIIASSTGGKGTVYLDELSFSRLEPPPEKLPKPSLTVSSQQLPQHAVANAMDEDPTTSWFSERNSDQQLLQLDFGRPCEFGGLIIDWDTADFARNYTLWSSVDGRDWEKVFVAQEQLLPRSYIPLKEQESRFVRLEMQQSNRGCGFGIREMAVKDVAFSETPEALYRIIARDARRGLYPRYLSDEQIYWTVVGAPDDDKEALISEDGTVEVDKSSFSLEPFIVIGDSLFTWADVDKFQTLARQYLPIPTVRWAHPSFELSVTAFASGPRQQSDLWLRYSIKNNLNSPLQARLVLAIRPFQVNPPWQFLNWPGGIAPIHSIRQRRDGIEVNGDKVIYSSHPIDKFSAVSFVQQDILEHIRRGLVPEQTIIRDTLGFASAAMQWNLELLPNAERAVDLVLPFYPGEAESAKVDRLQAEMAQMQQFWHNQVGRVQFDLPPAAQKIIDVLRSNLAYILINRDGAGIQPGSRSYDRSWIRDGSLTSAALLRFGLLEEARTFLEWYSDHLFPNGKVPCVVDRRGPDPVPENDSNGQFIFAVRQYYLFSKDADFLRRHFHHIKKAVAYLDEITAQRSSEYYRSGNDSLRSFYGLVPESISHEGYSAKPMHSYWDNFFTLLGYKDAVRIAEALHAQDEIKAFRKSRDRFRKNLYNSLANVFRTKNIDFIPGCVELADFDATSTAIALFPCEEWENLPQPQAGNTFERYYDYFQKRLQPDYDWTDFTPYEVRLIGAFIRMGEYERAHPLLQFFLSCRRPEGWNHWAEVVWKNMRAPRFIGDMPHTWVGSDFINSVRAMFVYEDEASQTLIVAAALPDSWIEGPHGVSVNGLPTYWGTLDYSIEGKDGSRLFRLSGEVKIPKGGIFIPNQRGLRPRSVTVNGRNWIRFNERGVRIDRIPCTVQIIY